MKFLLKINYFQTQTPVKKNKITKRQVEVARRSTRKAKATRVTKKEAENSPKDDSAQLVNDAQVVLRRLSQTTIDRSTKKETSPSKREVMKRLKQLQFSPSRVDIVYHEFKNKLSPQLKPKGKNSIK